MNNIDYDHPFITFMIPVFNGAELVSDAINSVLSQPCKDFQILILDDGSTDETYEVCKQYENQYPEVTLISHKNMGLGKNRNEGFRFVKGESIIFLDHDDLIIPNFYTNETRDFIKFCFDEGINVIVPARLRCNLSASYSFKEKNKKSGVFPGEKASWWVEHEFATLIYNFNSLKKNKLVFSETRPEMETIFRHRAVYCSPRVLFTNSFWFAIRRENPKQITKNWNKLDVLKVRINEYKKLFQWHVEHGSNNDILLNNQKEIRRAEEDYVLGLLELQNEEEAILEYRDHKELFDEISDKYERMFRYLSDGHKFQYGIRLQALRCMNLANRLAHKTCLFIRMMTSTRKTSSYIMSADKQIKIYRYLKRVVLDD